MPERDDDATGHTDRRRFVKALGALGVVGLAGCGGDGDSTDSPTDTTAPEVTTDSRETTAPEVTTDSRETTQPGGVDTDTPTPEAPGTTGPGEGTETPSTETPTDSMDTPSESLGDPPAQLLSLSSTAAPADSTTTISATLTNPYLFDVHAVEVSMSAPNADWTVEATGDTSFDTIDAGGERSVSWDVTVPEGVSGDFTLPASVSYESATDSADLSLEQPVAVFTPGEAPTDGLIGYFPLEGTPPSNAVSDGAATVGGNPVTDAEGAVGSAYGFDGEDDYLALPEFTPEGGSVSVSMWVYTESWSGGTANQLLFWGGPVPNHTGVEMWVPADGASPGFFYWDGMNIIGIEAAGSAPPTGEWVHLCGVYDNDSGTWKMYVNGEEASSADGQVDISLDPVDSRLASHAQDGGDRFFGGRMDEVRFYDRALSAAEVASIASQ